ncbi:hypothetical protein Sjap_014299 [Stephania japonica]|uniref:non-specific serine/threonine protein kinase n=1 Tax=Stephania japonica TaxID=461633 RepID=A0AAP0J1L6_9MAGN
MDPAPDPSPASEPGDPFPGKLLFGKYSLGKLLGCGASGKVYQAKNISTNQTVAIKCINKSKIVKSGHVAQIEREISIMGRLHHHPNIVTLLEVLATKTKIYFVMEFAKGGELFNLIEKHGRLSENLSRRFFRQLISAVRYYHSLGIFHRDLKPENLLLDGNGVLKVSDFGLSAVAGQTRNDGLLHTMCGTPAYVAPEILGKKGYGGAGVDVWSCGVILFVLNTGYLPFNDANLMAMYRKIYRGQFRIPRWVTPDLQRLLKRLLDPNPETRMTVDEIVRDPWFVKGGYADGGNFEEDRREEKLMTKLKSKSFLNAFEIISFSSGFDLSGLFGDSCEGFYEERRLVSGVDPEKIVGEVEEIARGEKARVARVKGDFDVEVVGQNGNLLAGVRIYRLNEETVVVEIRPYERGWGEKLKSVGSGHR